MSLTMKKKKISDLKKEKRFYKTLKNIKYTERTTSWKISSDLNADVSINM